MSHDRSGCEDATHGASCQCGAKPSKTAKQLRADYIQSRAPFVRELARFLVHNQVSMSIKLEMGSEAAADWARLRRTVTPLFGYPTEGEAAATIAIWLGLHPLPPTKRTKGAR